MLSAFKNKLNCDFIKMSSGNILEWYDFTLYGLFAVQLSKAFFASESRTTGLLMVFMTFAVGFLARPLGACIFGMLGDNHGRKYAVNLSTWMMLIPTLLIGLIPTSEQIGIIAPFLLIVLRLLQGLSAGGQFSGLIVVAYDNDSKYRSFLVSMVYSISVIGSFVATAVSYASLKLTQLSGSSFLVANSWRIPFLLSSLLFMLYYFMNREFDYVAKKKDISLTFKLIFNSQPLELATLIVFTAANGAIYYILFTYLVTYLEIHLHFAQSDAFLIENAILLLSIILYPWFGYRSIYKASRVRAAIYNILWMLFAIPLLYLSNYSPFWSLIGLIILVINECALTSYMISVFAGIFNNFYRMAAFSIAFNIGASISGFAPLLVEYISKFSKFAVLEFLSIALLILLGTLINFSRLKLSALIIAQE